VLHTQQVSVGNKKRKKERSIGWMRSRKEADNKKEKKRTCTSTGNSVEKLGSLLLRHIDSREEDQTNSLKVDCWQYQSQSFGGKKSSSYS
jgi:hypothetical protein